MSMSLDFVVPERFRVEALVFEHGGLTVTMAAAQDTVASRCAVCDRPSRRVRGSYTRTLSDLPWCGAAVRLRVRVRKFNCDNGRRPRKVFAERRVGDRAPIAAVQAVRGRPSVGARIVTPPRSKRGAPARNDAGTAKE